MSLRISTHLRQARWVFLRRWFTPRKPLFHATTGPRAGQIMRDGFRSDVENRWGNPAQVGISTSRNLAFMLEGHFGNYILVLDEDQVRRRFQLKPVAYPNYQDEYETRIMSKRLGTEYIQGLIVNRPLPRFEIEEWAQMPFPVVHKEKGKWVCINEDE